MENFVKGKEYDVGNDHQYCKYCSDTHQYRRHYHQYLTYRQKRFLDIKRATANSPKV